MDRIRRVSVKFKKGKEPKIEKHPPSHRFDWEGQVATGDGTWIQVDTQEEATKEETKMREFDTGATRDNDDTKPDYEGFFSPLVFRRFGKYMQKHQVQADGETRDSDNWQKGIPAKEYMRSWWRHFMDTWFMWRRCDKPVPGVLTLRDRTREELEEISDLLCASLFNNMGMLHRIEKEVAWKRREGLR